MSIGWYEQHVYKNYSRIYLRSGSVFYREMGVGKQLIV